MILTNKEVIKITKGKTNKNWIAKGISINSKTIKQGNLFIALKGNKFNGHKFIHEAFKNGASAAVVEVSENIKEYEKYPLLIVKNNYQALLDIAQNCRKNYKGKIVAITGSVGKTTAKEMLKLALKNLVPVYASEGNFNNNIGLPLCLANIDNNSEVAIFELGMNSPTEISFLSNILQPHYAIITTISRAHTAFFNSLEEIFLSKMEIIEGLKKPKILIFNINNRFFLKAKELAKKKEAKIYGFGKFINILDKQDKNLLNSNLYNEVLNKCKRGNHQVTSTFLKRLNFDFKTYIKHSCSYKKLSLNKGILASNKLLDIEADFLLLERDVVIKNMDNQIKITQKLLTKIGDFIYAYNLSTFTEHKGILSVLILGVVYLLKYDIKKAINNLSKYSDVKGRGNFTSINLKAPNCRFYILDDSYNASPLSMKKSILSLKDINLSNPKILVLGDMLELSNTIFEHQNLKEYVLKVKPKAVFTIGSNMKYLIDILPSSIDKFSYLNEKKLLKKLISYLQNDDIVLIKGSLGSKIYKVAEELNNLNTNN